jgi:hypothetical protein
MEQASRQPIGLRRLPLPLCLTSRFLSGRCLCYRRFCRLSSLSLYSLPYRFAQWIPQLLSLQLG